MLVPSSHRHTALLILSALLAPCLALAGVTTQLPFGMPVETPEPNGDTHSPALSEDGRYLAFVSAASNLVEGDDNQLADVFLHDQETGVIRLLSQGADGQPANGNSSRPSLSADGRFVAFLSEADNLVPDDSNGVTDVFVLDLQTGQIRRASLASSGEQANGAALDAQISADGRSVAFSSSASNLASGIPAGSAQVYVRDLQTGSTRLVSVSNAGEPANEDASGVSLSADGGLVAFESAASNLAGAQTEAYRQIFLHDLNTGETRMVSRTSTGEPGDGDSQAVRLAADGRALVFLSAASNLAGLSGQPPVQLYHYQLATDTLALVSKNADGQPADWPILVADLSADGETLIYATLAGNLLPDTAPSRAQVYLVDLPAQSTRLLSQGLTDTDGNNASQPVLSGDALFAAFATFTALPDDSWPSGDRYFVNARLYRTPTATPSFLQVTAPEPVASPSRPNGRHGQTAISDDGQKVVFESAASNLVAGDDNNDWDIFLYQPGTQSHTLLSRGLNGEPANHYSREPDISANGRFVAFTSWASNLVADDNNQTADIFVLDMDSQEIRRVSLGPGGIEANGQSSQPSLSADGRYVAFVSEASNLVEGDDNQVADVFVHDRQTGQTMLVSRHSHGELANAASQAPRIAGNGRLVAFASSASNLVDDDDNAASDVFVHNLDLGTTRLVSRTPDGQPGNGDSIQPTLSDDGRLVAFASQADNLVSGDDNPGQDVFVRDLLSEQTRMLRPQPLAGAAYTSSGNPTIAGSGRHVFFNTAYLFPLEGTDLHYSLYTDLVMHDLATGASQSIYDQNPDLFQGLDLGRADISGDGRHITFITRDDRLESVSPPLPFGSPIFLHDRLQQVTPDGSLAGSWYDPARDGEGFLLDVASDADGNTILAAYWFTYSNDGSGQPLWLVGAALVNGWKTGVDLYSAQGARFGSGFDPADVQRQLWGRATFSFEDCGKTGVYYDSADYGSGSIQLQRLTGVTLGVTGLCTP